MRLSTVTTASNSVHEAVTEANKDDHGRQRTTADEDLDDEVVDERNAMAEVKLPSTFRKSYLVSVLFNAINEGLFLEAQWTLVQAAHFVRQTDFPVLVRRFLFDQLNPNPVIPSSDMIANAFPVIGGNIFIFNSAVATFYAPSDISGVSGMRREFIRATPSWRNGPARYDCVIVNTKPDADSACGFEIARVFLFFSFLHGDQEYSCAFVQWYSFVGTERDEDTGYWMVEPDIRDDGTPHVAIIHIDCIVRAAHLMPVTRTACFVDQEVTMHTSLNKYNVFYVNRFVDHHAFVSL